MTMSWCVSLPVWGPKYFEIFKHATWPGLKAAIAELKPDSITLMIYTDHQEAVKEVISGYQALIMAVPGPDMAFKSLSAAHHDTLDRARRMGVRTRVCLLTADMMLSKELLLTCEKNFHQKKGVIGCMSMRTCVEELPPQGMDGPAMLNWAWEHRHPMTEESTWPHGRSYDAQRMYFSEGGNVACRLALPHPIALVRGNRSLNFSPTIDVNLVSNWSMQDIYVITRPEEGAVIELSPKEKEFVLTEPLSVRYETRGPSIPQFVQMPNPRHRWLFQHLIEIKGNGRECGDGPAVRRLIHGK